LHSAFHDAHSTLKDVITEGDKVTIRWSTRRIHPGEFMRIPPTGNRVAVASIGIFRFPGGEIVET